MRHSPLLRKFVLLAIFTPVVFAVEKPISPPQTFVRFKSVNADKVYAALSMRLHQEPFAPEFGDLPRAGRNYARTRIPKETWSDWAELAPGWGTIVLRFAQDKPLVETEAEVQIASAPDEKTLLKSLRVKELGSIVSICLPQDFRSNPEGICTVRENAASHLKWAQEAAKGQSPKSKFPFLTGGLSGLGSLYSDVEIARTEFQALRTLGINGFSAPGMEPPGSIDKKYLSLINEMGFDHFVIHGTNLTDTSVNTQKTALSPEMFSKIHYHALFDEPGNSGLHRMDSIPVGQFHEFLEMQGLKPKDFGREAWDSVTPIKSAAAARQYFEDWGPKRGESAFKRFYWTMRFAQELTLGTFREGTEKALKFYGPNYNAFVNFSDHPLILGGGMLPGGPDWFQVGQTRATTMMWAEDWMYQKFTAWGNGLLERVGFLVEILRSAASKHDQTIGFYNVWDDEAGIRLKTLLGIAHGVKTVYFWDYGPTYAGTENFWSDSRGTYDGIAEVVREVSFADELILAGKPPKNNVAVVYATTGEMWDASSPLSNERQMIWIALEQQQYPADLLNEELLLSRDLAQYKLIYVVDKQIPSACQKSLAKWTKDGGTLVLMPEAATCDEYDRPSKILGKWEADLADISDWTEDAVTFSVSKDLQNVPVALKFRACTWNIDSGNAKTVATFADARPAIQTIKSGKGSCILYSFMPGNNFLRKVGEANPQGAVKVFPLNSKALISWPCDSLQIQQKIKCSTPGITAHLLESEKGAALILLNWSREKAENVEIEVCTSENYTASSYSSGSLQTQRKNGVLTLKATLGLTDVIKFTK